MTAAAVLAALFALLIAQAGSANAGLLPQPTSSSNPDLLGGLTGTVNNTVGGVLPSVGPLPSLSDVTGILPTPVQSVLDPVTGTLDSVTGTVTGTLNDTITTVDNLLRPQDRSGEGNGGGTGTSGGSTTGGSKTSGHKGSKGGTTTLGGAFTTVTGAQFRSPYGTTAGHAAAHAASRALHLLGPLAPALLLAALAFGVLMILTRGSARLVKIDPSGIAKRTWRL